MTNLNKISYPLNGEIVSKSLLQERISSFFSAVFSATPLTDADTVMPNNVKNERVAVIIVIEYSDDAGFSIFKALGKFAVITEIDLANFTRVVLLNFDFKNEEYHKMPAVNILFNYKVLEGAGPSFKGLQSIIHEPVKAIDLTGRYTEFEGYKLPLTTNLIEWGSLMSSTVIEDGAFLIVQSKLNNEIQFHVEVLPRSNKVCVMSGDLIIFEFEDVKTNSDFSFRRIINNQEFVYLNGVLVLKYENKRTTFLKRVMKDKEINNRFTTLDLETRMDSEGIMTPYCACVYNGEVSTSFYLSDFSNPTHMLKELVLSLLKPENDKHVVYVHNLSGFDAVFLVKVLGELQDATSQVKVNIVKRDSAIINITITFVNRYVVSIRDSLLMLPSSLKKLAKSFKVEDKGVFPYAFANTVDLDYKGSIPDLKYFNLSEEEYLLHVLDYNATEFLKTWSLKDETIKYCTQDCVTLYQVLVEFNKLIFKMFKVNINRFPTLPSVAYGVFRSKYLKTSPGKEVPILIGDRYQFIKKSYTGGAVDMFIPATAVGEKAYGYDVNSLYPFVMFSRNMPVGIPKYFKVNNIALGAGKDFNFVDFYSSLNFRKPFGFFKAEITSPEYLEHPILQGRTA